MDWSITRLIPRSLFGRSLLIIVLPLIFVQVISTYVFFDRHWESITRQFADNIAGQICTLATLAESHRLSPAEIEDLALEAFNLEAFVIKPTTPPERPHPRPLETDLDPALDPWSGQILVGALEQQLDHPFTIDLRTETLGVEVMLKNGQVLTCRMPHKRLVTKTTVIYILWSLGTSVLFLLIAVLFMRNQIRPLRRLAEAAQNLGKGRPVDHFKPEGATEVRKVGKAFIVMRDRLRRFVDQRTEMLAGVSHDLRTPLTRMRLQLALLPASADVEALQEDIREMEAMITAYLAFARGQGQEEAVLQPVVPFVQEILSKMALPREVLTVDHTVPADLSLMIKPQSLQRCLVNLLSNALRYGQGKVAVTLTRKASRFSITIDDNGPGIPRAQRTEVFRPFYRLESSRNPVTGGTGLGLTIAQDSVQAHGGSILLGTAPLGGLRVQVRLPL